jgi:hypothetical protein
VYRARRVADGKLVALKQVVAAPASQWPSQMARIRLVGRVEHPNLGRHLDAFVGPYPFDGEPPPADEFEVLYTVMTWVDGSDLTDAATVADLVEVLGWVREVAGAAAALHRQATPTGLGIVHRDIKPPNVRVTPAGSAVLVDFGIARPLDGTAMTLTAGAPGWMPPEAFTDPDRIGPRSDVWQVAGLAAWAVLGAAPGTVEPVERRARLVAALRDSGMARPARLARHIDGALATSPAARPADAERWGADLVSLAVAAGVPRRRGLLLGAVAAVVLAVAAVAYTRRTDPPVVTAMPEPPVGEVTVGSGAWTPRDRGSSVEITVAYRGRPPAGGRLQVVANGGSPAVPHHPARPCGSPWAAATPPSSSTGWWCASSAPPAARWPSRRSPSASCSARPCPGPSAAPPMTRRR